MQRATPGSRDAARGERAVGEIGGDTRLLVLDVTDDASIADAARQAGTLDILVNNAGISGDGKTLDQQDSGAFRRIYETNVFGVVAVTNAFLPALRRSAQPRIMNVSSGTGRHLRSRSTFEGPAGGTRARAGEGSDASRRPCFRRSAGTPAAHRSRPGS